MWHGTVTFYSPDFSISRNDLYSKVFWNNFLTRQVQLQPRIIVILKKLTVASDEIPLLDRFFCPFYQKQACFSSCCLAKTFDVCRSTTQSLVRHRSFPVWSSLNPHYRGNGDGEDTAAPTIVKRTLVSSLVPLPTWLFKDHGTRRGGLFTETFFSSISFRTLAAYKVLVGSSSRFNSQERLFTNSSTDFSIGTCFWPRQLWWQLCSWISATFYLLMDLTKTIRYWSNAGKCFSMILLP